MECVDGSGFPSQHEHGLQGECALRPDFSRGPHRSRLRNYPLLLRHQSQGPCRPARALSHEHHVNELGIDCRYCHTNVEKSANAGVPPVHTCMSCHSQIWTNSPLLEPIRDSYATNTPIRNAYGETGWNRLNKVPEFVYFNHSIHVNRGINCNYCHGPVQTMQLMYKGKPFFMAWCLNCHRHPENYVRDNTQEFTLYRKLQRGEELTPEEAALAEGGDYQRTPAELEEGRRLLAKYHVNKAQLTDCWVCHR